MNKNLWFLIGGAILLFFAGIGFSQSVLRPHHPRFDNNFERPRHEYNMPRPGNNCGCNNCGCNNCNCKTQAANCNCGTNNNGPQGPMMGGCPKMMKKMGMAGPAPMMGRPHHQMRNDPDNKPMPSPESVPAFNPEMPAPQPMSAE